MWTVTEIWTEDNEICPWATAFHTFEFAEEAVLTEIRDHCDMVDMAEVLEEFKTRQIDANTIEISDDTALRFILREVNEIR